MAGEELNVEAAVDSISADLGLGTEDASADETHEVSETAEATQTTETTETTETEKPAEAAAKIELPATRQAPKAWAKETHELWTKLPPEAQAQIEHREKQMLDGLTQYSESAKFGNAVREVIKPNMELLKSQNIAPDKAIEYLFNAHRQLSTGTPEQKLSFFNSIAKTYGIDIAKATATATGAEQEPAALRELRERTDRLERERQAEREAAASEMSNKIAKQVSDFAEAKDEKGAPKHPHFDECAEHIVKLIHGGYSLDEAYQIAIYANPVTKEKELSRLQTEKDIALRAKAKQEADKARNASRTNVTSRDTGREATPAKGKKWEDTLDATFAEIKDRQTH